jgi:hypothetical protein|tara:strand:+ start:933 stop:1151 length:219 start_codon:yes stop_codon:yes gene_type:complete
MTKVLVKDFTFRIVYDSEDALNPVHLAEEIQCYLNSNHSIRDDDSQDYVNAEVTGYKVTNDNITPFIAQEEY